MEENKNKTHLVIIIILVLISVILAIAVGVLSILYLTKQCDCQCLVDGNKTTEKIIYTIETQTNYTSTPKDILLEHELYNKLQEYGKRFYEDFYYNNAGKDFVAQYTEIGIKVNANTLIETYKEAFNIDITDSFKYNGKDICKLNTTIVAIYPKEPFGVNDYDLRIAIDMNR